MKLTKTATRKMKGLSEVERPKGHDDYRNHKLPEVKSDKMRPKAAEFGEVEISKISRVSVPLVISMDLAPRRDCFELSGFLFCVFYISL